MKKRNSNIEVILTQNGGGCCSPKPNSNAIAIQTSCCGTDSNAKTVEEKPKTGRCC